MSETAVCVAFTDGVFDLYKDQDGHEKLSDELRSELQHEVLSEARLKNTIVAAPYKFQMACEAYGYTVFADDVTELIFGSPFHDPGVLIKSVPMDSAVIDKMAREIEQWCINQGWDMGISTKVELVFEEKMMNLYDHAYKDHDRTRERACFRLQKKQNTVDLTIWDWGTMEPSVLVAAGNLELEMELKNRDFSDRGRGRLMVRGMCKGIERNRFDNLNETIYRIALDE